MRREAQVLPHVRPEGIVKLGAEFSRCRTWRYSLTREWGELPPLVWMLLNPSMADEFRDDPTIRRCIGFSMVLGFGGCVILNLFALRSTYPCSLMTHPDPVGPGNDAALRTQARAGRTFACGWGNAPLSNRESAQKLGPRVFAVQSMLREAGADVRALKITSLGQPHHPLYLKSSLQLIPFPVAVAA